MSACRRWGTKGNPGRSCPCFDSYYADQTAYHACNLDEFEIQKQEDPLPERCRHLPALQAVAADQEDELTLVAVPKDVEVLVGWRKKVHEPIEVDPLTGCVTMLPGRERGPDAETVWCLDMGERDE